MNDIIVRSAMASGVGYKHFHYTSTFPYVHTYSFEEYFTAS